MPSLVKFKVAKCDLKESRLDRMDSVKEKIFVIRGQRVMLDRDLAELYGVTTKRLNEQFTRNRNRFPADFAFRLTLEEAKQVPALRLQNTTLKRGQHIKPPPHAFTEHGAIMLASVLNSRVAVQTSVYVVRAFVQMRAALIEYAQLSRRIDALEDKYDGRFNLRCHPRTDDAASDAATPDWVRRISWSEEEQAMNMTRRRFLSLFCIGNIQHRWTIAALEGTEDLEPKHLSEAVQYRTLDREQIDAVPSSTL